MNVALRPLHATEGVSGLRAIRLCSVLLLAIVWIAPPARAQPADPGAPDDLGAIDEIVVTITKRSQALTEVAATISAFDANIIEQVDIQSVADAVNLIPNAQVKGDGDGSISIRGISQSFTSQAPVAMHMNGIWRFQSSNSFLGSFYDLESIQVQRGPVGTVYGRNATAGAFDQTWKKPHSGYEVQGDATVGSDSLYMGRGALNIPLLGEGDERLMGRFVFQRETRDSYIDLINRKSHDAGVDLWYLRGSLRSVLSEDLELTVRGSFARDRDWLIVGPPLPSCRRGRAEPGCRSKDDRVRRHTDLSSGPRRAPRPRADCPDGRDGPNPDRPDPVGR